MNKMFFRPVSFLLGLIALTMVGSTTSVRAETPSTSSATEPLASTTIPMQDVEPTATTIPAPESVVVEPTATAIPAPESVVVEPMAPQILDAQVGQNPQQSTDLVDVDEEQATTQHLNPEALSNNLPVPLTSEEDQLATKPVPIPGTVETSSAALTTPIENTPQEDVTSQEEVVPQVAQVNIDPGRPTRGGASYVGIGGNIGLGGDTALGSGAFVINGKLGLTRFLSFRPAAIISDDAVFLLPLTYDFVFQSADPFAPVSVAPFVGGGLALSTDEDDNLGFVLTGGVDFPFSAQFIANASLNVGFIEGATDFGLLFGIGYTFAGF